MAINITIDTIISGTPNYNIWVCDSCFGSCVYIDTISTTPYTFTLPTLFETYPSYIVKIVDFNDCTYCITPVDAGKQFQDGEFFDFMDGTRYEFQ
jgi:hypothetical protein